ncbi:MAG TPA: ABC transporter ATP-binding protein [Pseudolabrys sp.]|nr:ABC transporter ATP-binding protein [Pseudolabrys sp.]
MTTPVDPSGSPAPARDIATVPISVSVRNLCKTFDTNQVLKDVSLDIRRGEFFSLLGPSGCGKTTLLRSIGGFEMPSSGEIHIDGKDMQAIPPYGRPTNMIFQQLALFPHLTVFENVAFGLRVQNYPKDKIAAKVTAALALVRLDGFAKRMPQQLSGGQQQRVAMARALVNEPSVLLLDEPLGALDLQLRLQMHEELRRLQRTLGNTFVFVTHDQGEAMSMSDRIAVMNAGVIVQLGTPEEIYERPATRFVAQFVGHTNLFDGKAVQVNGGRILVDSDGLRLTAETRTKIEIGQPVTVVLRYERLGLEPGDTALNGTVVERMYLGGSVRVIVDLDSRRRVTADITSGDAANLPAIGSPVILSFSARDARVLVA